MQEVQVVPSEQMTPEPVNKYMGPLAEMLVSINLQNQKLKAFVDYHFQKLSSPNHSLLEIYEKAYDLEMKGLLLFDIAHGQKNKKKLVLKYRVLDPCVVKEFASVSICWKNISTIFQTIDKTLQKELEFAFIDFDIYGDAVIGENLESRFPLLVGPHLL